MNGFIEDAIGALVLLLATATIITALWFIVVTTSAQERVASWTFETCYTNSCIKNRLDSLSADRASEAKLTTWDNMTYVWYRK